MKKNTTSTEYTVSKVTRLYLDALRKLNETYGAIYDAVDAAEDRYEDTHAILDKEVLPQFKALQSAVERLMCNRISDNLLKQTGETEEPVEI